MREHISIIRSIGTDCLDRFETDHIYRGALLHYLYLMADTVISLSEMIISYRKLRPAQSYSEAIDILGDNGILNADFAYRFAGIAGFRNFLAHDYEKIEGKIICENMISNLEDVEKFIRQVESFLEEV